MTAQYNPVHSEHITAESTYTIRNNAYSFGCTFAEVEVDIPMCRVKLVDMINVHDCGRLINPALAEAQVHGGMSMAIGYGLSEQLLFDPKTGRPLNNNLLDYKLSTFMDHPDLRAEFIQNPEPTSPFGTKALGEPRLLRGPPLRNAIYNATGVATKYHPHNPPCAVRGIQPCRAYKGRMDKGGKIICTILKRCMRLPPFRTPWSFALEHPEAQIIAGGSDVLVQMREGKRAGKELISIYGLDELRGVSIDENDSIRIGSLTSFSHITRDPIIQKYINVLGQAVDMVGGPQIRNIGTIGGNTCNGVTSADSASTLHAWEAIVELTGSEGKRLLPIRDFYIKAGLVDIRPDEIQTAIIIPKASYENTYGHYIKYSMRNAMDIATLGCSVNVRLSQDKKIIERARIAYGVAGPVPMRAERAEAAANGQPVSMETVEAFARTVLDDINPRDSWRASKAFRQHIAVETAKRCMTESIILAGGEL